MDIATFMQIKILISLKNLVLLQILTIHSIFTKIRSRLETFF